MLRLSDNASSKQSRNLAEELGKAVDVMGKGKNGVGFGKVDITVEKELQQEFGVKKAPSLKLFFEGNRSEPITCKGEGACVSSLPRARVKPTWLPEGEGGRLCSTWPLRDSGSFWLVATPFFL